MPRCEAVSTLHWPKIEILPFIKFLQKKLSQLEKIIVCTYCMNLDVLTHIFFSNHNPPKLYKNVQELFCQAWKLFLQKFKK